MSQSKNVIMIVTLVLCYLNVVYGLNCYFCTSCETLSSSSIVQATCPTAYTYCVKLTNRNDPKTGVLEGCATNCLQGSVISNGTQKQSYCCQTNLCNKSTSQFESLNICNIILLITFFILHS